jgi:hypothetical protein
VVVVHFKTADKLLSASNALFRDYAGNLNAPNGVAADGSDLERRVKQFGKGIGDVSPSTSFCVRYAASGQKRGHFPLSGRCRQPNHYDWSTPICPIGRTSYRR